MLRTVFIGHRFSFNEVIVHWLSRRSDLRGVVWTDSIAWQGSLRGRLAFAKRRLQKRGALGMLDEALLFLYQRAFRWRADNRAVIAQLVEPYRALHGSIAWRGRFIVTDDPNHSVVLDFIRAAAPDVALAACTNTYFAAPLRSLAKHGLFLWHEGITPEYKGLYSPFWTIHNLDFHKLGYTLLRTNERYDAGEVFVQGSIRLDDPAEQNFPLLGHRAILESLPAVGRFLEELEAGTVRPIERPDARPRMYSYPGLSDYLRQRWRVRRFLRARERRADVG